MAENELKVGDTVYGNFGRYSRIDVREGVVVKVTPTGRVNADFGDLKNIQFKDGRQVGGDRWYSYRLINREEYEALVGKSIEQKTVQAMYDRLRNAMFNTKAEALALADEIKTLAEAIPDSYGA